MYTATH